MKQKIQHEHICDCGKPATYNLQGGGWVLWSITPKGNFKKDKEWGLGESGENSFYCDDCAEKEQII
jgi:hypothetical protein